MADNNSIIPSGARDQVTLAAFIESIIKDKNDPSIKPESMPEVVEILLTELNDQINAHMINILPEEKQRQLEELLDKEVPDAELDGFFEKNIPNLDSEIAAVLLNFRAGYLGAVKPGPLSTPSTEESVAEQVQQPEEENLMPAPPAPVSHTPFDATQISSDKAPTIEDKPWN